MNISTCEYSSGCESGWTMYLDQLSNSSADHLSNIHGLTNCEDKNGGFVKGYNEDQYEEDQEDDEDLSMVSDASSGPPHVGKYVENNTSGGGGGGGGGGGVYSQYYGYYRPSFSDEKTNMICKSNTKETGVVRSKKHQNLCLDDTASSPVYDFSQDNVAPSHDYSQLYSNLEGEYSRTKKHFGFFKSSSKGKSGNFLGRKRQ